MRAGDNVGRTNRKMGDNVTTKHLRITTIFFVETIHPDKGTQLQMFRLLALMIAPSTSLAIAHLTRDYGTRVQVTCASLDIETRVTMTMDWSQLLVSGSPA